MTEPRVEIEAFIGWLLGQAPEAEVGFTELLTENSPLGRHLKERYGLKDVYLGPNTWIWETKTLNLPDWAVRFEARIAQLPAKQPISKEQAWEILVEAFWAPYLEQAKKGKRRRVKS